MNKLLLPMLVLLCRTQEENHECALGIRIHPFRFISETLSVEMRAEFRSNCLEFGVPHFFVLPHDKDFGLSSDLHPRRVILSLFGKAYQFDFSAPVKDGKALADVKYTQARVSPSAVPSRISLAHENNVLLRTTETNVFTKEDINALFYKKNPSICSLETSKKTLLCRI